MKMIILLWRSEPSKLLGTIIPNYGNIYSEMFLLNRNFSTYTRVKTRHDVSINPQRPDKGAPAGDRGRNRDRDGKKAGDDSAARKRLLDIPS